MEYGRPFMLLLFGCLSLPAAAQTQPDAAAFSAMRPDERRRFVVSLNMEAMDTATFLKYYRPLLAVAEQQDDQRAHWALNMEMFMQRNALHIPKEEFLPAAEALYDKAKKQGWEVERTVAEHYLQFEKYDLHLLSLEKMYAYILTEFERMQALGMDSFKGYEPGRLLYHGAKFMYDLEDFEKALAMLLLAERYPEVTDRGLQILIFTLNLIESIYQQQKAFEQGVAYAQKLLDLVSHCPSQRPEQLHLCNTWQGIACIDIADMLVKQGKFAEGETYADRGFELVKQGNDPQSEFDALLILAPTKLALGKLEEAARQLKRMEEIYSAAPNREYYYFKNIRFYETYAKYHEQRGDLTAAYRYSHLAKPLQDSLDRRNDARKLEKLKQLFEAQKYTDKIRLVENEKQLQKMLRNALIVILALVLALAVGNFHRMRYLRRQSLKELEAAKNDLELFTRNLREKSELAENLNAEIQRLSRSGERSEYLEKLTRSTILTDDDWTQFRSVFEKVYPDFIAEQKQLYPGLTQAELRYLVLEKLGLSTHEMANMLGVSDGTIRQTRMRLKRKTAH